MENIIKYIYANKVINDSKLFVEKIVNIVVRNKFNNWIVKKAIKAIGKFLHINIKVSLIARNGFKKKFVFSFENNAGT